MQPYPPHKKSLNIWLLSAAILAASIVLFTGVYFGLVFINSPRPLMQEIEHITLMKQTCTIGYVGAAVTITIIGFNAHQDCADAVASNPGLICGTQSCPPHIFYLYSGTPNTPELCEGDYQQRHIIIRDYGLFDIYGNELCQFLLNTSATPVATP